MKEVKDMELQQIEGGGLSITVVFVIGAIITLIAGIIDGFTNPTACRGGSNG